MKKVITVKPKPDLKKPVAVDLKSFNEVLKLFPYNSNPTAAGRKMNIKFSILIHGLRNLFIIVRIFASIYSFFPDFNFVFTFG